MTLGVILAWCLRDLRGVLCRIQLYLVSPEMIDVGLGGLFTNGS